jgi:SP family general alpha glucoside:H+ symporter-like MFS transporter
LFIVLYFAPESPWHLVRKGKYEAAELSLLRLSSGSEKVKVKQALAMLIHTNSLEKDIDAGTSYWDCFKGIDRRRTEIVCMVFAAQPFCGSAMGGTPTYFFVQAGLPTGISFQMSIGGLGLAAVGTIISWWLLHAFGRRTLYIVGLAALTGILVLVGIISAAAGNSAGGNYAQAAMMLVWLLVYYMTVGPICYAIISETNQFAFPALPTTLRRLSATSSILIC